MFPEAPWLRTTLISIQNLKLILRTQRLSIAGLTFTFSCSFPRLTVLSMMRVRTPSLFFSRDEAWGWREGTGRVTQLQGGRQRKRRDIEDRHHWREVSGAKAGKKRERERCASYLDKSVKIAKQEQQSKSLKVWLDLWVITFCWVQTFPPSSSEAHCL